MCNRNNSIQLIKFNCTHNNRQYYIKEFHGKSWEIIFLDCINILHFRHTHFFSDIVVDIMHNNDI